MSRGVCPGYVCVWVCVCVCQGGVRGCPQREFFKGFISDALCDSYYGLMFDLLLIRAFLQHFLISQNYLFQ